MGVEMFCGFCGFGLGVGERFCGGCGEVVPELPGDDAGGVVASGDESAGDDAGGDVVLERWWDGASWSGLTRPAGSVVEGGNVVEAGGVTPAGWYPDPLSVVRDGGVESPGVGRGGVSQSDTAVVGGGQRGVGKRGGGSRSRRGLLLGAVLVVLVGGGVVAGLLVARTPGETVVESATSVVVSSTVVNGGVVSSVPVSSTSVSVSSSTTLAVTGVTQGCAAENELFTDPDGDGWGDCTTESSISAAPTQDELVLAYAAERGLSYSSGVLQNGCGDFAVVGTGGSPEILMWDGGQWIKDPSVGDHFSFSAGPIEGFRLFDLTSDGVDELVVQVGGGMRTFGAVFTQQGDCTWGAVPLIDSCGSSLTYDALDVVASELVGSGFSAGCAGRDGIRFEWSSVVQRFIGRSSTRAKVCDYFDFDAVALPLTTCDEGWAVYMAQDRMFSAGIQLDVDGYFGPGTHRAVLQFQLRNNLEPSGIVDLETWGAMFPADWGYPDYDGDGISTPTEMAHS